MNLPRWFERSVGVPLIRMHDKVYKQTNGRVGHRIPGIPPALLLHTVGAKTGQPRSHSLTYARDGGNYVIVASNGGADRNPAWYHNLRANPDVEINVGTKRFAVHAHQLKPGDSDYDRLWAVVNKHNFGFYTGYQSRTSRPIPVIVLTPQQ